VVQKNPVEAAPKKNEKATKKAAQEAFDAKLIRFRSALTSLVPLRGIPMDLAAHFVHASPGGSLVLITARIDSSGFSFEQQAGGRNSALEVLASSWMKMGKPSAVLTTVSS
jgi:carbonic anhydrase